MTKFAEQEKHHQALLKSNAPFFSKKARGDGVFQAKPRSFCLPLETAEENLFSEIREVALAYFSTHEIRWHNGEGGKPFHHLCSSQVCCVNFLFPFANQPVALAALLRPIFPTLAEMLPLEDGLFVAFEWIGEENYLGEKNPRNGKRTRGEYFTSADAAVMFRHTDGHKQMVLIEWKYTESYALTSIKIAKKSGTDRGQIYAHFFQAADCPLDKSLLPSYADLFYEPFYQFMRQQFLAHKMEKARELDTDIVSLLHISPAHNTDFKRITSPNLRKLGDSATGVWSKLLKNSKRFLAVNTEELFGQFETTNFPGLIPWKNYITGRYPLLIKSLFQ